MADLLVHNDMEWCKMATTPAVLQSSLCFLVNRFGKVAVKPLKNMILDFYDVEELNAAKQQLLSDVNNMNLRIDLPHIPWRRDGDPQKPCVLLMISWRC